MTNPHVAQRVLDPRSGLKPPLCGLTIGNSAEACALADGIVGTERAGRAVMPALTVLRLRARSPHPSDWSVLDPERSAA
jgi:hypothetical protein